jgi:hypothetical protein
MEREQTTISESKSTEGLGDRLLPNSPEGSLGDTVREDLNDQAQVTTEQVTSETLSVDIDKEGESQ